CSPEGRRGAARGRNQSAQAQGGRADHRPGHFARGRKAPYDAGDVRGVMATWPGVSMRRVCRVLKFSRARLRARAVIAAPPPRLDEVLAERIQRLIELYPTFGYRRLWAMLRFVEGIRVNRKAVYRLLLIKGWFVHQRSLTPRPRVQGRRSSARRSNERWAMDVTHVSCGADGWGHLTAVIDCHDREVTGYEFGFRGRAGGGEAGLQEGCFARLVTLP